MTYNTRTRYTVTAVYGFYITDVLDDENFDARSMLESCVKNEKYKMLRKFIVYYNGDFECLDFEYNVSLFKEVATIDEYGNIIAHLNNREFIDTATFTLRQIIEEAATKGAN